MSHIGIQDIADGAPRAPRPLPKAGSALLARLTHQNVLRWLFPAPAILLMLAFTVVPLLRTLQMSFQKTKIGRIPEWIGLENYIRLFTDGTFWPALYTTTVFTIGSVLAQLALGMAMALLLVGPATRLRGVVRTLFLLPMVLSPVVVGIVWRSLFNPQFGWVNMVTGLKLGWLSDPALALPSLMIVDTWQWTPFVFVILLSGLLGLPQEVIEASRIDGATAWQRFSKVIFPMILPLVGVVALLRAIEASKMFDLVFNLTSGGPGRATETLAFYTYRVAFKSFDQGYAAAITVVLSVLVGSLIAVFIAVARRASRRAI